MDLKILGIHNLCTGCGACVSICARKCLELHQDREGFYYPTLISGECVSCHLCEKVCPIFTEEETPIDKRTGFIIYKTDNQKLLEESSSGGAFSLLADSYLKSGGIVFGSIYNGNKACVEVSDSDSADISLIRKSKYVESYTGNTFYKVRLTLNQGRNVLFCGTPCQIIGLKRYLEATKTDQKSLLTVDFVCHGVPSIGCLRSFLSRMGKKKKITHVDFRFKDFKNSIGWRSLCMAIFYENGGKKLLTKSNYHYYYYYQPFLDDLMLRQCCYNCNRVSNSKADITIGDYWAVSKYHPEWDDNKGLSFLKLNSPKGKIKWEDVSSGLSLSEIPFEENKNQYAIRDKQAKLIKRNSFYRKVSYIGYINTTRIYYTLPFILMKLRGLLSKVKHLIKK